MMSFKTFGFTSILWIIIDFHYSYLPLYDIPLNLPAAAVEIKRGNDKLESNTFSVVLLVQLIISKTFQWHYISNLICLTLLVVCFFLFRSLRKRKKIPLWAQRSRARVDSVYFHKSFWKEVEAFTFFPSGADFRAEVCIIVQVILCKLREPHLHFMEMGYKIAKPNDE